MNNDVSLKGKERLDDLQLDGLFIIQNPDNYLFTCDAVELANYVSNARGKTVADFCSGSGIISILIAHKKHPKIVYGVEINSYMAEMSARSVRLNDIQNVDVIQGDVKNAQLLFKKESIDIVVSNPPYRKLNSGEVQSQSHLALARHEILLNHEELISAAAYVLKCKGSLYLVHQFERLAELFYTMKNYGLEPKELHVLGEPLRPSRVIIRAVKGGNVGLKMT
ncbi:MAG: methyltransferase [Clostridia bacterium]|nr:methyltransferase [Clostridia bacterium]